MSIIGPRPALFNQDRLIELRNIAGLHILRPGLTGWAQINGRDLLSVERKIQLDAEYMNYSSLSFDFKILFKTILYVFKGRDVTH
jgi:O-antigen biosynthesis protein WbqP